MFVTFFGPSSPRGLALQFGIGAIAIGMLACAIRCFCYRRSEPILPIVISDSDSVGDVSRTERVAQRTLTESLQSPTLSLDENSNPSRPFLDSPSIFPGRA